MQVKRTYNPLTLSDNYQVLNVSPGRTPNQIILENNLIFERPFYLLVNGCPVLRDGWDTSIAEGSQCHFVELPRGGGGDSNPLSVLAMFAVIALSAYTGGLAAAAWGKVAGAVVQGVVATGGMMLVNMFFGGMVSGERGTPDTVYSLTSGANRIRIGSPFVEHFGRFICYPDMAMAPYAEIEDNDQYLYFLGIIGVGEYDIESVLLDRTPILDYVGTEYNILSPGVTPTLCSELVWTSDGGNQELTTDWLVAVVSAPGTCADTLGFDVIFPAGLIRYNKKGKKRSASASVHVEARRVDYTGEPLTTWTVIYVNKYTARSVNSLRYSMKVSVPHGVGRYEIRIKRGEEKSESNRDVHMVSVGYIRAYGEPFLNYEEGDYSPSDYGDVTMIEAKIKATDQLNGDIVSKINVIATRKLTPVTPSGFGTTKIATRSIVDACAYVVTCENGGKQQESILDFESLAQLKSVLGARENYFDWRFTSRISVMDACAKIARCGRAVPYMPSGFFSLVRDELQILPSQSYSEDDYTDGSLEMTHAVRTEDSSTCVEVQYVDPDTWQTESVICLEYAGSTENPAIVQLDGCTDRQHAYEEGMYMYKDDELNRTSIVFRTGLKGNIPRLGQKVVLPSVLKDWNITGQIAAIDGTDIWVSEPISIPGDLYICLPSGEVSGPHSVVPIDNVCHISGNLPSGIKTQQTDDVQAARFIFGYDEKDVLELRVNKIQPQSRNEIRISGSIIHDEVYGNFGDAPLLGGICDGDFGAPVLVGNLSVHKIDGSTKTNLLSLAWSGSAEAFRVEYSTDGESTWIIEKDLYTQTSLEFELFIPYDDWNGPYVGIVFKVTAYEDGVLNTLSSEYNYGYQDVSPASGLSVDPNLENGIIITWYDAGVTEYEVELFVDGELLSSEAVTETTLTITNDDIYDLGGPWPEFTIYVSSLEGTDTSYPEILLVVADVLPEVTNFILQSRFDAGVNMSWDAVEGATEYQIYMGDVDDFTPGQAGSSLVHKGGAISVVIGGLAMTGNYEYFFKVAATNGYISDVAKLNFSDTLIVEPEIYSCTTDMVIDLIVSISGNDIMLFWGGSATKFKVVVEQTGESDKVHDNISGSQRTVIGLVAGDFTATVTPYRLDEVLCVESEESVTDTIP